MSTREELEKAVDAVRKDIYRCYPTNDVGVWVAVLDSIEYAKLNEENT